MCPVALRDSLFFSCSYLFLNPVCLPEHLPGWHQVLADDTNQDRMRSFICVFRAAREYVSEYESWFESLYGAASRCLSMISSAGSDYTVTSKHPYRDQCFLYVRTCTHTLTVYMLIYIYMYIHIHPCIYIYVISNICKYIHIYIYVYIYIHKYKYKYIYIYI